MNLKIIHLMFLLHKEIGVLVKVNFWLKKSYLLPCLLPSERISLYQLKTILYNLNSVIYKQLRILVFQDSAVQKRVWYHPTPFFDDMGNWLNSLTRQIFHFNLISFLKIHQKLAFFRLKRKINTKLLMIWLWNNLHLSVLISWHTMTKNVMHTWQLHFVNFQCDLSLIFQKDLPKSHEDKKI